jgi:hypothetical protein
MRVSALSGSSYEVSSLARDAVVRISGGVLSCVLGSHLGPWKGAMSLELTGKLPGAVAFHGPAGLIGCRMLLSGGEPLCFVWQLGRQLCFEVSADFATGEFRSFTSSIAQRGSDYQLNATGKLAATAPPQYSTSIKCWTPIPRLGIERAKLYLCGTWPSEHGLGTGLELAARGFKVYLGSLNAQDGWLLRLCAKTQTGDAVRASVIRRGEQFGVAIDFQQKR